MKPLGEDKRHIKKLEEDAVDAHLPFCLGEGGGREEAANPARERSR